MEKLVVMHGYLKELFPFQLVDEEEHTLARIRCLELFSLPDLEKIWNQDLRVDQLLQNLETLIPLSDRSNCDKLSKDEDFFPGNLEHTKAAESMAIRRKGQRTLETRP
ncbi:hypothetical protein OIU78_027789 [Salix suchowensis]|nr:hypothetical protein OIU78_027789 [Salix suchowensis]